MKTNSTSFPILLTERLILRQLSITDGDDILALRSDPKVNQYLDRQPSKNVEDAINFIHKMNGNIELNNSLYWAITLSETKQLVGTVCLFDFSEENRSGEIGYELMPNFQKQGIMKEALQAVINFAFDNLGFQKILAFTHPENQHSAQLLLKLNFVQSIKKAQETPHLDVFTLTQPH